MAQGSSDQNINAYNYYDSVNQTPGAAYPGMGNSYSTSESWGQEGAISFNQQPQYPPSANTNSALYKTKLCRHFQTKGHCNMGDNCNFAHGMDELKSASGGAGGMGAANYASYASHYQQPKYYQTPQPNADHSNSRYYKTVLCRNFQETGQCQFGDNCKFAHGDNDLKPMPAGAQKPANVGAYPGGAMNYGYYGGMQSQMPAGAPYGYDMAYQPYQGGEGYTGSYDMPGSTNPSTDATPNYNYNYAADPKYYQGFGYDASNPSSQVPPGGESSEQYYSQAQMMPPSSYSGEGASHYQNQ